MTDRDRKPTRLLVGGVALAIVVVAALLVGIGRMPALIQSGPTASPQAPASIDTGAGLLGGHGDPAWEARVPALRRVRAVVDLAIRLKPGGEPVVLAGTPEPIERGQDLILLGDPVSAAGVSWARAYVVPYTSGAGPDDLFAWIPLTVKGQPSVQAVQIGACPDAPRSLVGLAGLDSFSRLRCAGTDSFSVEGTTWEQRLPVWYAVTPAWLGGTNEPSARGFSIHAGPIQREVDARGLPRFLDVQVPDRLASPPVDFVVDLDAHLGDATAETCGRAAENGLVPIEDAADSRLWCAARVVADRWSAVLGPERRAIDPLAPQLHRFQPGNACGGVGMPLLTFRMDATKLDPIWLEVAPGGRGIVPWFSPGFRAAFVPNLVVIDGAGHIVARDGTKVNPDADLSGHPICPTSSGVYFT